MYKVTWFEDLLLDVVHPAGRRIGRKILDDPNATFVWGKLMDPAFIKKQIGRPAPFCAAEIRGYARVPTREFYALRRRSGATTQGVVLLGLTDKEVDALNRFEQTPHVMERRRIEAAMGNMRRKVFFYIKSGSK